MSVVNKDLARKAFASYVRDYNAEDGKIQLKIKHTYRVTELSERIANTLPFSEEEKEIAWLIGLLHDVGRFEQCKQFDTFNDAISVNHAEYGIKVLFEEGHIRDYISDTKYDKIIHDAILYHNLFRIPEGLSEKELMFCKVIRDADKIDILRVTAETSRMTMYGVTDEEMVNQELTKEVVEEFYKETAIHHKYKKTDLDTYLSHASLVFELEFPESYVITKEQGFVEEIFSLQKLGGKNAETMKEMEDYLNHYVEKMLK